MSLPAHDASRSPRRADGLAAIGYGALVAGLAWPLVRHPASSLVDPGAWDRAAATWARADLDLLVWIVAWTAHGLVTRPLAIFDGNIFYPAADALASSEHLLGLLPITAPSFWLSHNAVLTYNVAALAVVWIGAFTMYLLARSWSGRPSAAFLAGSLFALGSTIPLGFVRLHTSAVHLYPLVLLLAWRVAEAPRWGAISGLVGVTALQVLSGIYVAFGLATLTAAAAPSLVTHARRRGHSGLAPLLALAAGAAPLAVVAGPYLRLRAAGLLPDAGRALDLVTATSGTPLGVAQTLYGEMTAVGLALAALGLASRRAPVGARSCLVTIAVVGAVLSLGTYGRLPHSDLPSLYEILMAVVPGFAGMRAPQRFLYQTQLALCGLAALGGGLIVDVCRKRFGRGAATAGAGALVVFALVVVPWRADHWPLPVSPDPMNGLYVGSHRWLAENAEPGPVLDLPAQTSAWDTRALRSTGRAMLGSTLHWYPLLNGYSGYPPASHTLTMVLAQRLPDAAALRDLCAIASPRWIVVHHGLLGDSEEAWRRAEAALPITPVRRRGRDAIYEVRCPGAAVHPPWRTSAPPLAAGARRAAVEGPEVPPLHAGALVRLWTDVTNLGDRTWPGLRAAGAGGVVLRARWYDATSGELLSEEPPLPLARELRPGQTVRAQVEVVPPSPGPRLLEIEIGQEGGPAFTVVGSSPRRPVHVLPAPAAPGGGAPLL